MARLGAAALLLLLLPFPARPCGTSLGCNNHGRCGSTTLGTCECEAAYNVSGHNDCSARVCAFGAAWTDHATATDTAHAEAECSNMGVCDRLTGLCTCRLGFGGDACQYMLCPLSDGGEQCSGHGSCFSMREAAEARDDLRLHFATTYTLWDADKVHGCVCDEGFTGYDCSVRRCPSGFNSLLTTGVSEQQVLNCRCDGGCEGYLTLSFRGHEVKLHHADDAAAVQSKLLRLPHLDAATITMSGDTAVCSTAGTSTHIDLAKQPGDQPPLRVADSAGLTGGTVTVTVSVGGAAGTYGGGSASRDATTVSVECSNRGLCDSSSGICSCASLVASSGGTYGSSDGAGAEGLRGDCGNAITAPTTCPFVEVSSVNINCAGSMETASGTCDGTSFECACHSGFTGWDCSLFTCPTGTAWFDEATAPDTAHAVAECSNRGLCDRSAGTCLCQVGFSGVACESLGCPGEVICGGKGTCYSMQMLALLGEDNGDLAPFSYTTAWDATKIYGCYCDKGYYHGPYSGDMSDYLNYDCSELSCPTGDNPQTLQQHNEIQTVTCDGTSGTITLSFRQQTTAAIAYDATAYELETALELLSSMDDVTLTFSSGVSFCTNGGTNTVTVEFAHQTGDLPLITGDATLLTGGGATLGMGESRAGTTEDIECSGQGNCDRLLGTCACYDQYVSSDGSGDGITGGMKGDCGALNTFSSYEHNFV